MNGAFDYGYGIVGAIPGEAFTVNASAKGATRGEIVNGLKNIGFSLRIVTPEEIHAWGERESDGLDIPEVRYLKCVKVHEWHQWCVCLRMDSAD
jgi:hypothetical protein